MGDTSAKITITAQDLASDVFARINQALEGTKDQVGDATEKMKGLGDQISSAFEDPLGAIQALGGAALDSLGIVGAAVGVLVGVMAGLTMAITELGEKGSEVDDVAEGFTRLAGTSQNASDILEAMQTGLKGTVDNLTLMTEANKLLASGATSTAADFGTLTQASLVLAHEGFGTSTDMLNTLSTAMETGRTRRLAMSGVVVDAKGFEEDYAASLGLSADQLSTSQKLAADRQAILAALSNTVDTAGDQELTFAERIAQGKTAVTNWTQALEVAIARSPVLTTLLDGLQSALSAVFGTNQTALIQQIVVWVDKVAIGIDDLAIAATYAGQVTGVVWAAIKTGVLGVETAIVGIVTAIGEVLLAAEKTAGALHLVDPAEVQNIQNTQIGLRAMTVDLAAQTAAAAQGVIGQDEFGKSLTAAQTALLDARTKMQAQTDTAQAYANVMTQVGWVQGNVTNGIADMGVQAADTEGKTLKLSDAAKAYIKAWADLDSIGESYRDTVSQINPQLVTLISNYIEAGAKVGVLATAFSDVLTPAQVQAIDDMTKANDKYAKSWDTTQASINAVWDQAYSDQQANGLKGLALQVANLNKQEQNEKDAAAKKITDETQLQEMLEALDDKYTALRSNATTADAQKTAEATTVIWNGYYDNIDKASMSATDYAIAQQQRKYDDQVAKAIAAGIVDTNYYTALEAANGQAMDTIYQQHDKYAQDTKKLLADLTDGPGGWVDTFSNVLVHSGSFKDAVGAVWGQLKTDTLNIFADLLSGIIHSFLDALLKEVEDYVAEMLVKLAVLTVLSFFSGGGVATGGGGGEGGGNGAAAEGMSTGGVVYAANGFIPRGTDTVPAMLTPGERVLSVPDTQEFEHQGGLAALRAARAGVSSSSAPAGGAAPASTAALEGRIDALHATMKQQGERFAAMLQVQPTLMRHALRGAH